MYADKTTDSMSRAIDETNRRRDKQIAFNEEHGIQPVGIYKAVRDLTDQLSSKVVAERQAGYRTKGAAGLPKSDIQRIITELEKQMKEAAKNLEFEKAAVLRDQIYELRSVLAEESKLPPGRRSGFCQVMNEGNRVLLARTNVDWLGSTTITGQFAGICCGA